MIFSFEIAKLLILIAIYCRCLYSGWDHFYNTENKFSPRKITLQKDYNFCNSIQNHKCDNLDCESIKSTTITTCRSEVDKSFEEIKQKCNGYLGMLNTCQAKNGNNCKVQRDNFYACQNLILKSYIDIIADLERSMGS
jgi:hypothetical protein